MSKSMSIYYNYMIFEIMILYMLIFNLISYFILIFIFHIDINIYCML